MGFAERGGRIAQGTALLLWICAGSAGCSDGDDNPQPAPSPESSSLFSGIGGGGGGGGQPGGGGGGEQPPPPGSGGASRPADGCTPGAGRCRDDRTLLSCTEDAVEEVVRCASDELCGLGPAGADCLRPAACDAGARWCDDATTVARCGDDQQVSLQGCPADQRCSGGTCAPSPTGCVPGESRCRDLGTALRCDDEGEREEVLRCAGDEVCTGSAPEAACVGGEGCPLGASVCLDARTLRVCQDAAAGWQEVSCGPTATCDFGDCIEDSAPTGGPGTDSGPGTESGPGSVPGSSGVPGTGSGGGSGAPFFCVPGVRSCDGNTVRTCNGEGSGFDTRTCASGERCEGGACVPATDIPSTEGPICDPGSRVCDGNTVVVCNAQGTSETRQACASTERCTAGACLPVTEEPVCSPGTTLCEGNGVRTCNAQGTGFGSAVSCGSDVCVEGACRASCPGVSGPSTGCVFHPVLLDQIPLGCSGDTDCDGFPGSVCRSGECVYETTSNERLALGVTNTTTASTRVRVLNVAGDILVDRSLPAGEHALIGVPVPSGSREGTRITTESFRVESDRAISVVQYNPPPRLTTPSNDASALIPADLLGTAYDVLTWPASNNQDGASVFGAYLTIVATARGTTSVTVRPSVAIASGAGVTAIAAGATRTFSMERGETLTLYAQSASGANASRDLSGTRVTSTAPVAVFAGTVCSQVPLGTVFCDHMEHQLAPSSGLGSTYVIARTRARGTAPDVLRVLNPGSSPVFLSTTPLVSALDGARVGPGQVLETRITTPLVLEARTELGSPADIAVAQFTVGSHFSCTNDGFFGWNCPSSVNVPACNSQPEGDPSFMPLAPVSRFAAAHDIHLPSNYTNQYIEVVFPSGATVRHNGTAIGSGTAVGASGAWRTVRLTPGSGLHRLRSDDPFGVTVYGFGCGGSFGYSPGLGGPNR